MGLPAAFFRSAPQSIFLRSNKRRSSATLSFSYFYFRAPEQKQTRRETNTAATAANNARMLSAWKIDDWSDWRPKLGLRCVFLMRKRSCAALTTDQREIKSGSRSTTHPHQRLVIPFELNLSDVNRAASDASSGKL